MTMIIIVIIECIEHTSDKITWGFAVSKTSPLEHAIFESKNGHLLELKLFLNKIKLSCKTTFLNITVYTRSCADINVLVEVSRREDCSFFFIFTH